MKEALPKTYNPKDVEDEIYQRWEKSGYFNPDNLPAGQAGRFTKPFSIAMPPANVTAELHLGSAMFVTIQDLMTRLARMSGKKALWLPGTDHAAIATQNVVERQLWQEEKKTRLEIGKEALLVRIDEFIKKTQGRILLQIRKMGASCDWSREKYTLSPELTLAVRTIFKQMHDAGLIYRGERIVNWCPRCGTTLADDEVEHKETTGTLYYIRYPLPKQDIAITIATTRPETMLADTAVAVNPDDPRYKKLVGQSVILPILNRELPIIADAYVDRAFGTGALKITPGHDPNDFEIGQKHKLATINLFTPEGKISEMSAMDNGFEDYAGLTPAEAREKILTDLQTAGFLEKTEPLTHSVGHCYRCDTMVEPIVSKQWFIGVNEKFTVKNEKFRKQINLKGKEATLKEMAVAAVKSGAIKIVPERFTKIYLHWMENLRDWNISRQIWFGHQIPVWYCQASSSPSSPLAGEDARRAGEGCQETIVAIESPNKCPNCGNANLVQDPDTLDTWFSSSLWTFSTLGWPSSAKASTSAEATADTSEGAVANDLETYHPTTIMETGYDILFFWVARMVIMTGFALEDIPFRTVYLHGLVTDQKGKKMSKSRGNMINPLTVIEKHGTDALRLALVLGTTPGNNTKISEQKIETYRNFVNKLWNISRFILSSSPSSPGLGRMPGGQERSLADSWILSELDNLISQVHKNFETHQYGQAGEALYDFTWNKFADWYIEISKTTHQGRPRGSAKGEEPGDPGSTRAILIYVLQTLLKLWHPFIPFVTEHIWSQFNDDLLMIQEYPTIIQKSKIKNQNDNSKFQNLQELITGLRNLRSEYHQPPAQIFACYIEKPPTWLAEQLPIMEKLARVRTNIEKVGDDKKMPYFLWPAQGGKEATKVFLILPHFDTAKELGLAEKELTAVKKQSARLKDQLGTKEFVKKAPKEIVEKMQADFESARERQTKLEEKIKLLK